MIPRHIAPSDHSSFFLFGPRGSGKSTFLRELFKNKRATLWIDLLNPEEEAIFQSHPSELLLRTAHLKPGSWVIIDEVQKTPKLLDLVHKLIEEKTLFFALSGSSARKLKRGAANLLAGRAFVYSLFPFTSLELKSAFDLDATLRWGTLPKAVEFQKEEEKKKFLQSYASTYLREEIQIEQIVRNLPTFRRFLEVAAQMNGKILNFSKIGNDIHADHSVVRNYYEILEDTLIGFQLFAFDESIRKQQKKTSKFYFFDCGVKRALDKTLDTPLREHSYDYGNSFEHFLILEFYKLCQYREKDESLFYLQTKDNLEVDLIIRRPGKSTLFIEIKSTSQLSKKDAMPLKKITTGLKNTEAIILSRDKNTKSIEHVRAYYWKDFVKNFYENKI